MCVGLLWVCVVFASVSVGLCRVHVGFASAGVGLCGDRVSVEMLQNFDINLLFCLFAYLVIVFLFLLCLVRRTANYS